MPEQPGEAQKELGIEKEASNVVSVINSRVPRPSTSPSDLPSTEEPPKYPEEVLKEFSETENFVSC
jgi:hypothetical protein